MRRSELKREKAWSRINVVPLLLAEQDRDAYRRQQAALAREKEIMKDYPGWEVRLDFFLARAVADESRQAGKRTYNSSRYTPNTIVVL